MSEPANTTDIQGEELTNLANVTTEELQNTEEAKTSEEVKRPENADQTTADATEKFQKQMNKKHFQYKEEERKRIALEKELDDLRAKSEPKPLTGPVDVPPIPDQFDDDYESKIAERDAAIAANADFNVQERMRSEAEQKQIRQQQDAEVERVQQLNDTFEANITASGVNADKALEAANSLAQYGIDAEAAQFILTDEDGPLIAMLFENDLRSLDEFLSKPLMERGKAVADLKAKAQIFKPKTTNAPGPALSVDGLTPQQSAGPAGATYE